MEGLIFDIQKFSINDGPGIRTTVFLKGCPLDCLWCHNPESKSFKQQLSFDPNKCTLCGACETVCSNGVHRVSAAGHKIDLDACEFCGACVESCPSGALTLIGKRMSVAEVLEIVVKDRSYYENSGGGLTISGGEPMSQFAFTYELAKAAKKAGIHVTIETSGYSDSHYFRKIASYVDLFLFDYKATGADLHKTLTAVDRGVIDRNLELLNSLGAKIVLRCPLIPNYNMTEGHFKGIASTSNRYSNIISVEILPYHNFGVGKGKKIGEDTALNTYVPEDPEVEQWLEKLRELGVQNVKRG